MNTRKMLVLFTVVLIAISTGLSGCGCGGDNSQPGEDAALDAGVDGGKGDSGVPDSGTDGGGVPDGGSYDAGPDGSVADVGVADGGELDAGVDAGTDAGADSGIDAGVDGSYPPDGSFDASADGGADAGSDAGIDGGKDLMGSSISAGNAHGCGVTIAGRVRCWGLNDKGQLGNGANTDSNVPVDVSSLSSGVASVASGQTHSCAVTTTGGVKCWGYNSYGQLGNGTNTNSNVPVDVSGLSSGVASVTGGNNFTCAVTTTGGVKCWGTSKYGQLGNGGVSASNVPVDVSDLSSGIKFASCGFNHTCAVTTTGGIKCWGYNLFGQLGNGTFAGGSTPVDVSGLSSGVANVAGGNGYTCAATEIGGVKCWGTNNYGQIGNGTTGDSYIPTDVQGLSSDVKAVAGGGSHSCAVTKTGGVKCWGNNLFGQLGDGTNTNSDIPVDVFGLSSGIQTVTGGQYHTCALTTTGGVKCWGDNKYGKLGDGTISISNVPVDVSGLSSGVAGITGGTNHTCAVTATGGVKCWGLNNSGQLGNSSNTNSNVPVDVSDLSSGVQLLAGGLSHACALAVAGGVKCWGLNNYGQLGNGSNTNSNVPVDVSSLSSGKKIATGGGYHTCVVTTTGGVECWGNDSIGQLGDGKTNTRSNVPVDVSGLSSGASIVAGGDYHTCAITTAGGVKCWGENVSGQLGTGTAWYLTPQDVVGL